MSTSNSCMSKAKILFLQACRHYNLLQVSRGIPIQYVFPKVQLISLMPIDFDWFGFTQNLDQGRQVFCSVNPSANSAEDRIVLLSRCQVSSTHGLIVSHSSFFQTSVVHLLLTPSALSARFSRHGVSVPMSSTGSMNDDKLVFG